MGNASSDAAEAAAMARVDSLRDQLADMERAVRHLHSRPQIDVRLLPHQARVCGHTVTCDASVRVLLGPVVGKVDAHSARVLLETDRTTRLTCHVLIHDMHTDAWVEVPQCRVVDECTPARRPTVFRIQALVPGRQYRVVFSGIHRDDALVKVASFHTPTLARGGSLRCAVVSGDDVYALESGERSLWSALKRAVVDEQRVQLVIHLGGQVSMKRKFDRAWTLLVRHAECVAPPVTTTAAGESAETVFAKTWATLEQEAMEILRSAYRTQWAMIDDKASVLANASNLMMWSDWDVYPAFTTSTAFFVDHEQPTLEMQVLRTVVRCARRLYHEYQRVLWDDDLDQVFAREVELHRIAEQALATTARIYQLGHQIPTAQADLELQKKRREIEGARKAERHLRALEAEKSKSEKMLVSYNQVLAPQAGEEFQYRFGEVGFLFVDMRSARVEPGGSQRAANDVLSDVQWTSIESVLEDETIQHLILCTETPIVDDLPHELRLMSDAKGECDFKTWWGSNAKAQQRLLGLVFEWKLQREGREVVFFSGSTNTRFAMKTTVRDTRLRTDLIQWMVGPLTAKASGQVIPSRSGTLFDRYDFEHGKVEAIEKTLFYLNVEALDSQSSSIDPSTKGQRVFVTRLDGATVQDPARVLVGPIVGHVDAISAMILLEVDRKCDLVCAVKNLLTGECHRVFQHFEDRRPNSFFLNHMRPEHFYEVSFERIQDPSQYRCSFTTTARIPSQFQLLAVGSMDRGGIDIPGQSVTDTLPTRSVWPWINDNLCNGLPFRGVDKMIHFEEEAGRGNTDPLKHLVGDGDTQDIRSLIKARVREAQRFKWSVPGVRQLLARGSHLILMEGKRSIAANDTDHLLVQDCVTQVRLEYENLLLPPSKRVSHPDDRLHNPIQFVFGTYGLFVLPRALMKTAEVGTLWSHLEAFLKTPLLSFVAIVSSTPIIEDAVEDAEEKARFDDGYRRTFAFQQEKLNRLLEVIVVWQQQPQPAGSCERRAVFVCGHESRSFDSIVQDHLTRSPLARPLPVRQFVIGPLRQLLPTEDERSNSLRQNVFPQGTLFGKFGYYHRFQRRLNGTQTELHKEEEVGSPTNPLDQPVQAFSGLLHLQVLPKPTVDDNSMLHLASTLIVSESIDLVLPPTKAAFTSADDIRIQVVGSDQNAPRWSLETRHPEWLNTVISQPLTEHEELMLSELKTLLDSKTSDIEVSFQRADPLAKGLVSADDRASFVTHMRLAIEDFHKHVAGMAFRSQYPAIPSAYVINFTLQELSVDDAPAISGAIDLDQYAAILVKCLQNAALFDSRLSSLWS